MKYILIFAFLTITLESILAQNVTDLPDSTYSEMLWIAFATYQRGDTIFQIHSTAPIYVVISVTDGNTGVTKTICTTENAVRGAITYDSTNQETVQRSGYYTFLSQKSLDNVGFDSYYFDKQNNCIENITGLKLKKEWENDPEEFSRKYSGECQKYYAHLLFEIGILSRQGCLVSSLSVVDKEREKQKIIRLMNN